MSRDLVHLSPDDGTRLHGSRISGNTGQRVRLGLSLCAAAGPEPDRFLAFALCVLRSLPDTKKAADIFWPLAGLLTWMSTSRPSEEDFEAVWSDLKQLYPRPSHTWRKCLEEVAAYNPKLFQACVQINGRL